MNVGQGERLARIEAILERMEPKVDAIESKVDADVKDMAALKNKGTGIIVGVAIAASGVTAGASTFWRWIVELLT